MKWNDNATCYLGDEQRGDYLINVAVRQDHILHVWIWETIVADKTGIIWHSKGREFSSDDGKQKALDSVKKWEEQIGNHESA